VPRNVVPAGAAALGGAAPVVSVVVATRDRSARLESLLAALTRQTLPAAAFELVVVDDASADGTAGVLARVAAASELRIRVMAGQGRGPAAARNIGWRAALAPLVAFTDDDCEPTPAWLAELLAAAKANAGGIVQGPTAPLPRERYLLRRGPARTKSIDSLGPWFQTCNILYPRAVLERVGGFDERFQRPFGEDADLAWRAIGSGAPPAFAPAAIVHHAVEPLSAAAYLRSALRDPDEALVFKRHAGVRREAGRLGLFKSESHALLVLALGAALVSRRHPLAAVAVLPYLRLVGARTRGQSIWTAPLVVGFDTLETVAALRGSVRHRVLAI
jgi:cellulose synthase/poly-beta-1,6-N-acetylglucosamine synthase-like glycosyltransferase